MKHFIAGNIVLYLMKDNWCYAKWWYYNLNSIFFSTQNLNGCLCCTRNLALALADQWNVTFSSVNLWQKISKIWTTPYQFNKWLKISQICGTLSSPFMRFLFPRKNRTMRESHKWWKKNTYIFFYIFSSRTFITFIYM